MVTIEKARKALDLKKLGLPAKPVVLAVEVEEYVDWSGDDSLRVWVVIDEDTDVERISGRTILDIKGLIHKRLMEHGIDLFPYVSFVKPSERELDGSEQ